MTTFHIYCDESCHLEHDGQKVMVLGALKCPAELTRWVAADLRDLKAKHNLNRHFELKWTKVSPAKVDYYLDVLDYFLSKPALQFRAVVVPDKSKLQHDRFGQTHDDFYYKLYYQVIRHLLDRTNQFRIFLDIKDTKSWAKTRQLQTVLANSQYDFDQSIVRSIELVRSEQVEQQQLADLLIGCLSYANRELKSNAAKVALVEHLRKATRLTLNKTTLVAEPKVNILVFDRHEADS